MGNQQDLSNPEDSDSRSMHETENLFSADFEELFRQALSGKDAAQPLPILRNKKSPLLWRRLQ